MGKVLAIVGMVVAVIMLVLFAVDLAIGIPFQKASKMMDVGIILSSLILGYLSWATLREQP